MKIKIRWLTDSHECETCGLSYAEGAFVEIDSGKTGDGATIDMRPLAACYGGAHYDSDQVYVAIFEKLGWQVESVYGNPEEEVKF